MVLIHDRILKIDIYNFEMSQITPEKSLKSNQIYSVVHGRFACECEHRNKYFVFLTIRRVSINQPAVKKIGVTEISNRYLQA